MIQEAGIQLDLKMPSKDVSREMEVFYNPVMKSNRDLSIALLLALDKQKLKIALPLCGSGIRAYRFLSELPSEMIETLFVNDVRKGFPTEFQKGLGRNNLGPLSSQVEMFSQDANQFLLGQMGFDYIDIDPFGSPNPFLSAAVARINRGGVLAVTATDTGALAGRYIKAGLRKYWARGLRCSLKHELGLRILIRKVQLQGVQFGKALIPILSYHKNHYYRVFFVSSNGKQRCDEILKQHQYVLYDPKTLTRKVSPYNVWEGKSPGSYQIAGPLWAGDLHDASLVTKMCKENIFPSEHSFLTSICEEAQNENVVGFIDTHELASRYGLENPKMKLLLSIQGVWRTQFGGSVVKTNLSAQEIAIKLKTMKE